MTHSQASRRWTVYAQITGVAVYMIVRTVLA